MGLKRVAEFILSAQNEASGVITKVQGDVGKLGGAFEGLGKLIGPALAGITAGLSIKGFADMVQHSNELTDSLRDSSIRLGVGMADLQAYHLAAENAGIGVEQLDALIGKMNKTVGEIKINQSSKEVVAAFERIGISVQQVKTSTPSQIFEEVIDKLSSIQDPAVRASTAMQIFGKQGQAALTLVNDGAQSLRDTKKLLEGMGLALNEVDGTKVDAANDALKTLSTLVTAAKQKLSADLAPAISAVANMLIDAGKNGHDFGKDIADAVDWAVNGLDRLWSGIRVGINASAQVFHLLESLIQSAASTVLDFGADCIEVIGQTIPQALNEFLTSAGQWITSLKQGFEDVGTAISNAITKAMDLAGEKTSAFINLAIDGIDALIRKSNELAGTRFDVVGHIEWENADLKVPETVKPFKFDFEVPTFGEDAKSSFRDLATLYDNAADATLDKAKDNAEDMNKALEEIMTSDGGSLKQKWDEIKDSAKGAAAAIGGGDYSGGSGIPEAAKKAKDSIQKLGTVSMNTFSLMGEYGKAFTSSLEKAIDDFTKKGEFSFRSFAASILQEIAAITMKAAILGDLLGNSKYGGNGSGIFGGSQWGNMIGGYLSDFAGVPKARALTGAELKAEGLSYDGGGFTGFGSRSGGMDGRGGFPAILHPNETVVDHTRGQSVAGSTTVHQTVIIRETMPAGQARAIQQAATNAAVSRVASINDRGGERAKRFSGRR